MAVHALPLCQELDMEIDNLNFHELNEAIRQRLLWLRLR